MDYFAITSRTCKTCGTDLLCDEETGAEVHRDPTYYRCGTEGRMAPLVERVFPGTHATPKGRHLRVAR